MKLTERLCSSCRRNAPERPYCLRREELERAYDLVARIYAECPFEYSAPLARWLAEHRVALAACPYRDWSSCHSPVSSSSSEDQDTHELIHRYLLGVHP